MAFFSAFLPGTERHSKTKLVEKSYEDHIMEVRAYLNWAPPHKAAAMLKKASKQLEEIVQKQNRASFPKTTLFDIRPYDLQGSTLVLSALWKGGVMTSVVGDSLPFLLSFTAEGAPCIKCLSKEFHSPRDRAERARVLAAGGEIDARNYVNGVLGMTRSIGDCRQKRRGIIAEPTAQFYSFQEGSQPFAVLLATDGVFEVAPAYMRALREEGLTC